MNDSFEMRRFNAASDAVHEEVSHWRGFYAETALRVIDYALRITLGHVDRGVRHELTMFVRVHMFAESDDAWRDTVRRTLWTILEGLYINHAERHGYEP